MSCPAVSDPSMKIGWINVREANDPTSPSLCAKGDGVTDDWAAFQYAITKAATQTNPSGGTGGGVVYIPPGIYLIESTLSIPGPCAIIGFPYLASPSGGPTGPIIKQYNLQRDLFSAASFGAGSYGLLLSGFAVVAAEPDVTLTANPGAVFHFDSTVSRVQVRDITLLSAVNGILVDGANDVNCDRIVMNPYNAAPSEDVPIGSRYGIRATNGGSQLTVVNCSVDESQNTVQNVVTGFVVDESFDNAAFDTTWCVASYCGFQGSASESGSTASMRLLNCSTTNSTFGVLISGGSEALIDVCSFQDGVALGTVQGNGIEVDASYGSLPLVAGGVAIDNMPSTGFVAAGSTLALTGSRVTRASQAEGSTAPGIQLSSIGDCSIGGVISETSAAAMHITDAFTGVAAISGTAESSNSNGIVVDAAVTGAYVIAGSSLPDGLSDSSNTSTRRSADTKGVNPIGLVAAPNPTSGGSPITVTNNFGVAVSIYIPRTTSLTSRFTSVSVDGTSIGTPLGLQQGMVRLPPGSTIVAAYTGSPTWTWIGD